MIEKVNYLAAAASLVMGAGGAVNFQNSCVLVRTGAGTYTVTVDPQSQVPFSIANLLIGVMIAAGVACSTTWAPPAVVGGASVFTITTAATLGGVAADVVGSLSVAVLRL